jgi:photosystem II stability/assembly factor-like uncharacterized protein
MPDQFVSGLLVHPSQPNLLYVGGRAGILKTVDGGSTWQTKNQGLATLNIRTVVMSPRDPQLLYAGTNGSGLYRSTDGGETWAHLPLKTAVATASAR